MVKKRVLKTGIEEKEEPIENNNGKWQSIYKITALALKNWWKIVLILLVIGVVVSGFTLKFGDDEIVKQPIYQKTGK